jgi:hypothetical protein
MRADIRILERQHVLLFGQRLHVLEHFDAWMRDHFERMTVNVRKDVLFWTDELTLAKRSHPQIVAAVQQMEATIRTMSVDQSGFYRVWPW